MLQEWLQWLQPADYPWLWPVFTIVLLTLLAAYAASLFLRRLAKRFEDTRNLWDEAIMAAAHKPVIAMILIFGLSYALQIILESEDVALFTWIEGLRPILVVGILTWFLIGVVREIESQLLSDAYSEDPEKPRDPTTVMALGKLARIAVTITAGLMLMQNLGYGISGVLAFGGIGGVVLGFAAKDVLANFFGGLMLYLDRPFGVGEWVRSPDQNIEGTVEYIGWRLTRLRTFDKRPLYVPNGTFTQISVENPSRMWNRRIFEVVGLRYDDARQVENVVSDVKAMLRDHPDMAQDQTMIVNFDEFGDSSLNFFVYAFTKTTKWIEFHEIKQDVLLKIINIIHERGADVAYPTSTIKLQSLQEPVEAGE